MHTTMIQRMGQHVSARLLHECYNRTFEVKRADTDELRRAVFELRYNVFCIENKFEDANAFADKMETDVYDSHADHLLLVHRASGESVGTVRVIHPDNKNLSHSFPLQSVCDHPMLKNELRMANLCEVSRLCISKSFRRRYRDNGFLPTIYSKSNSGQAGMLKKFLMRRLIPYAPLGLFKGAFAAALERGNLNCLAVMEPNLIKALGTIGFTADNLGNTIDFHGLRQPIIFNLRRVFENAQKNYLPYYNLVTEMGELHRIANQLENPASRNLETKLFFAAREMLA